MSAIIYLNNQILSIEFGSVILPKVGEAIYLSDPKFRDLKFKVLLITQHRGGFEIDVEIFKNE